MELNKKLTALCLEIVAGDVGSDRFTHLLFQTGVHLDNAEWDVANRILGKGDQIISQLGHNSRTLH